MTRSSYGQKRSGKAGLDIPQLSRRRFSPWVLQITWVSFSVKRNYSEKNECMDNQNAIPSSADVDRIGPSDADAALEELLTLVAEILTQESSRR
jgi:hypothetical protein